MPLQYFTETHFPDQSLTVVNHISRTNPKHIGDIGMDQYGAVRNPGASTALITTGAGPCQIILVHKGNGVGALGHLGGTTGADTTVPRVRQMVEAVGGGPVDTVLFAAGVVGDDRPDQAAYETAVIAGVQAQYPGTRIVWPGYQPGQEWGACFYRPLAGEVALFQVSPMRLIGLANDGAAGFTIAAFN